MSTDDVQGRGTTPPSADALVEELALVGAAEILEGVGSPADVEERLGKTLDAHYTKEFFLVRCLLDVQKAGFALQRGREFVEGTHSLSPEHLNSSIHALRIAALVSESAVWQRKLAEALFYLIGFDATPQAVHFELLTRATELQRLIFEKREQATYFGSESASLVAQIEEKAIALEALVTGQPTGQNYWYLTAEFSKRLRHRSPPFLSSPADLARHALTGAKFTERQALGYCYRNAFASPSGHIHFNYLPAVRPHDQGALTFARTQVGMLCLAIVARAGRMLGHKGKGTAFTVVCTHLDRAPQKGAFEGMVEVGDFVVLLPKGPRDVYLAEITAVIKSPYGNESYGIAYFAGGPFPGMTDDKVMPDVFVQTIKRKELDVQLRQTLREVPELAIPDDEPIDGARYRKALTMMWEKGMRAGYAKAVHNVAPSAFG